jgi:2-desacetyl-2-hydroxyethyl bacteriochlorophyllide A dehydrogenase
VNLKDVRARLRHKLRAHVLDALDERGLVLGSRLEFPQPGCCELRRFEESMPGPGEILVESEASVISPGTERAVFAGRAAAVEYPYLPGYSQAGRIVAAGDGSALQVGQRVSTGAGHATLHLCPADRAVVVPSGVEAERAALAQIGAIAMQGVRKAAIEPGVGLAVLGAGLIGQLAAQLARCAGADVVALASSPSRLAIAARCGVRTLNLLDDPDALDALQAEIVIDATGDPQAINNAIRAARRGARIVLLGSNRGVTRAADVVAWARKGLAVLGAHVATLPALDAAAGAWTWRREVETFLELARQQRLRLEPLVTRRVSPAEAPEAYADLARPDDKSVAVMIDWARHGPWSARVEKASPLRAAGALLLGAAGRRAPRQAAPRARADTRCVRFGLIGCGEIAAESAAALRAAGNATISFTADPDLALAESLAAATGARATSDTRELLASPEVDAVLVSTPHHLHAPLAVQAAEAGKHVVVEKPMATSVADCDRMIAAARAAGVTLSVCYCHRYDPRVQRARQLLDAGAIGQIQGVRIVLGQFRAPDYWKRGLTGRATSDWRARRETAGGGVLIMNACHLLDYMCWLVGSEVVEVAACASSRPDVPEVEAAISVSYRHANGALGTLDATSALVGPGAFEQVLRGSEGQLVVAPVLRLWSRRTVEGYSSGRWHAIRGLPRAAERRRFFEAFADALLDRGPLPVTAEEARAVQAVIEAAYRSAEGRGTVRVDRLAPVGAGSSA